MKEKIVPYLVQRCMFNKRESASGIDAILGFDYMGSAEFEFGALPKSLKAIREKISNYVYFDFKIINDKVVTVFCQAEIKDQMSGIIEALLNHDFRLKEWCDLDAWVNDEQNSFNRSDCWWDLENHFFFWKKNDEFEKEFRERIKGKNDK